MSLLRITNGFEKKSDSKLLEKANFVHTGMNGNTSFPTPTPSMTEFLTAITQFQAAVEAAGSGDRMQVAYKKEKRDTLVNILHLLGYYVLYASAGNRTKAQSSNFTLAKEPTPSVITKPVDLKVNNSNQTGQLEVSIKKVHGAVAYLHQYSTDPLLKEESWMSMTCSATKCTIDGLTPGAKYFLRVGAIGTKDQVMYSDVVSKIAA
jgi:hypothetical protein